MEEWVRALNLKKIKSMNFIYFGWCVVVYAKSGEKKLEFL